jgi:hypothetical protein
MRRGAGAIAILALTLAGAPAARAAVTVRMIFEDLRIYVPVAATKPLGDFILDTGASGVLADTEAAAKAGLAHGPDRTVQGAGSGQLAVGDTAPATLHVAGVPLRVPSLEVGALDKVLGPYAGRDVDGIIGGAFFREHVVTIDFARQTLSLSVPGPRAWPGPGVRLPFEMVRGVPVARGELTLPDGTRLPARLLVDLGAKANLLVAEPFVREHRLLERLTPQLTEPLGAGLGGETRYAFARLPKLRVGEDLAADRLIVGLSVNDTLRGGYYDALLGAGFLQHYRLTIDYPHRLMVFEPRTRPAVDRFDRSGAFVVAEGSGFRRFVVHEVVPGSPAAEAGVVAGDVIEALDGRPARRLRLADIRRRLSEEAPARLALRRAGQRITASVALRDLI